MLKMQKEPGKRTDVTLTNGGSRSEFAEALSSANIPRQTAQRWQELANVPKEKFEEALREPDKKPTTTGVLETLRPQDYLKIGSRAGPLGQFCRRRPDNPVQSLSRLNET